MLLCPRDYKIRWNGFQVNISLEAETYSPKAHRCISWLHGRSSIWRHQGCRGDCCDCVKFVGGWKSKNHREINCNELWLGCGGSRLVMSLCCSAAHCSSYVRSHLCAPGGLVKATSSSLCSVSVWFQLLFLPACFKHLNMFTFRHLGPQNALEKPVIIRICVILVCFTGGAEGSSVLTGLSSVTFGNSFSEYDQLWMGGACMKEAGRKHSSHGGTQMCLCPKQMLDGEKHLDLTNIQSNWAEPRAEWGRD